MDLKIEKGPSTLYPRVRHSSATDGIRYGYLLGSQHVKGRDTVERYDA